MSDISNENLSMRNCECYKKLQAYGIPLYINEENDFNAESQRKIIGENAFKFPGTLKINENITEYLVVEDNELYNVYIHMAEVIPNLSDFEENVLSFWILDMLIEGLWTAQNAEMNFDHQKATLQWIAYLFNYIQKENPTRRNLFDHLKSVLFHSDCKSVLEVTGELRGESHPKTPESEEFEQQNNVNWKNNMTWELPLPPNMEVNKKNEYGEEEDEADKNSMSYDSSEGIKGVKLFDLGESATENYSSKNLDNMKIILGILYRIFGRFWVYMEIQSVFHAMPHIKQVDLPFKLDVPKPVLKVDPSNLSKLEKYNRRSIYAEKSFEETDSELQLHKNDYILPLQLADESKLILKQFFSRTSSQRSLIKYNKT